MYGIVDNLALIINSEKELNLNCKKVSLFNDKIQKFLKKDFIKYINNSRMGGFHKWCFELCSLFRHALGHRIPLYVPPAHVKNVKR